jgi:Zn-dependent protease
MPNAQAAIRLFEFRGITVFLHISWFFVAVYELGGRASSYSAIGWNLLEYIALFAIVLLHEFGHALACRSVGGRTRDILLWPFGGIAYVDPPPRPGATLWSIAAGPLVNVALIPVLLVATWLAARAGVAPNDDLRAWLHALTLINVGLLLFNLMPVYPLDGGQILAALLWFVVGRARGLKAAALFGFVGVAGVLWLAIWSSSVWLGLVALFLGSQCLNGLRRARAIQQLDRAPRHDGFACPGCGAAPPVAAWWRCANCDVPLDPFAISPAAQAPTDPACPVCGAEFAEARCIDCATTHLLRDWRSAALTRLTAAKLPAAAPRRPTGPQPHRPGRPMES